jgi:LysR family transcriptional regulator, cys regulon transcriptional activator
MKLQQLRYVREVARQGLSISDAAQTLHTSQPGISKQIRMLEDELGVDIFMRNRNRVIEITPAGKAMLPVAQRMLDDAENLKRLGQEFRQERSGSLTVLTTHTQARYTLPQVVKRFVARYPGIRLGLRQGTPNQIWQLVANGEADFAIASEPKEALPELVMLKCYELPRIALTPPRHPLLRRKRLTLEALAGYPIITYDDEFVGHSKVHRAFAAQGLTPNLVLNAIDTDVIKAYVELGLGVAIVAKMAFDARRDRNLRAIDASHLFESNTVYLGFRRNNYLRRYALGFIEMLVPQLNRKVVQSAIDAAIARPVA